MYKSSQFTFVMALGLVGGICLTIIYLAFQLEKKSPTFSVDNTNSTTLTEIPSPPATAPPVTAKSKVLPTEALLDVPFFVQAPFARWDAIHKETCEEASLLMVRSYKKKLAKMSLDELESQLLSFVEWQTLNEYSYDLTVRELRDASAVYYNFNGGELLSNPTIDQIKQEIANDNPVIIPAAGRLLPNPYFTPPGPRYHMLVVIGYDDDEFITNDPGTRRGEKYRYLHSDLMNAIHNFTSGDITTGSRTVLVYR